MTISPVLKEHISSATQTFVATFGTVFFATLAHGEIMWTSAFWSAVILAAARAAIKEVFARFAPIAFGGRYGKTLFGSRR